MAFALAACPVAAKSCSISMASHHGQNRHTEDDICCLRLLFNQLGIIQVP